MKNAVTNKIRLLKNIKPNPDWLQSEKGNLLFEISQSGSGKKTKFACLPAGRVWGLPGFLLPNFVFKESLALKPVLVSLILFCLIFGGGFLTVLAAKNSLPGDLLYPIKLVVKSAQFKVSSQADKSKIQAEFIELRAGELSQIIENIDDPIKKKEQIVKTMDKLQVHIANTKNNLNKMKEAEPQKIVEVAEIISEKTSQSEEILVEAKEKLIQESPEVVEAEVVEAIDAAVKEIQETSTLASELKEGKVGIEVQMEVKEGEPEVEILPTINEASVSFEEIKK